jgi:hypothetical protein
MRRQKSGHTAFRDFGALHWQLDKDDVAQGVLRIVRDTHGTDGSAVVQRNPLVGFCELFGCSPRQSSAPLQPHDLLEAKRDNLSMGRHGICVRVRAVRSSGMAHFRIIAERGK